MNARELIKNKVAEGISQTEIARKCGISNGTITKILYSDTKLTLETIRKIARAYNIRLSDLISDIPENERSGYTTNHHRQTLKGRHHQWQQFGKT